MTQQREHTPMRWISYGYYLTGFLIALGGYGHSFHGIKSILGPLAELEPDVVRTILMTWHFAGGCMVAIGLVVMYLGVLNRRMQAPAGIALGLGAFYVLVGISITGYIHEFFFLIFSVQGAMLLVLATFQIRARTA